MNSLLPCPKCGCPDQLSLDSNSNAEASWIECGWCEHRMQRRSDEETLAGEWNEVSRENMPAFDLEAELVKLDKAPSQPGCEACARLRRTGNFWYDRAKKAERTLAQQPAAVDGAMVERMAQAVATELYGEPPPPGSNSLTRAMMLPGIKRALTAALADQPGGSGNDR